MTAPRRRRQHALRRHRTSLLAAGAVVVAVAAVAAAGLSYAASGHGRQHVGTDRSGPGARATIVPLAATAPHPPATRSASSATLGTYRVATTVIHAGPTGAPATTPGSHLSTVVWFPTSRSGTSASSAAGRPARGYPLIVFSQGFEVAPKRYESLLVAWASAGFVVAAPTYPYTDVSPATLADESDIVHHPADLRVVIGALLGAARRPSSVLFGLVDASEIGLAGQSDGGDVTLAVAANTCCRYLGIKAVAILSGAELSSFGGTYFPDSGAPFPPLLVVQGSADTVNVPGCSAELYDDAPAPKWYLDLLGAPHLSPYVGTDRYEAVVARVTTDFFEAELARRAPALRAMSRAGDAPDVARLSAGASAPKAAPGAAGTCPGSP